LLGFVASPQDDTGV